MQHAHHHPFLLPLLFLSLSYRSKHELGANEFKASTRAYFVECIAKLVARGAKGVVLGCTEVRLRRAAAATHYLSSPARCASHLPSPLSSRPHPDLLD